MSTTKSWGRVTKMLILALGIGAIFYSTLLLLRFVFDPIFVGDFYKLGEDVIKLLGLPESIG